MNKSTRGPLAQHVSKTIKHIRRGKDVSPHVMVGPIVWEPDNDGGQRWYFVLASGAREGARLDCIKSPKMALVEKFRAALYGALIAERPIVVHDFDDELEMARWVEATWPSPKTRKIRADMEAEQAIT